MKAPVAVEKLSERAIRLAPAPSFFEALAAVTGVQVLTPSLGFKVLNTRGFANTTNVRFAQLVDGLDNQAPHLGAPIGNALGPSDLDIAAVEIVPGTAAALYGLNAVNGLAQFTTRNPFDSEELAVQQKTGVNHLGDAGSAPKLYAETSVRWAHVVTPRLALKINGTYLRGTDWIADDRRDLAPAANATVGLTGADNPAYDPVNGYGNESANRRTLTVGGKSYAVARTGYAEHDVADYTFQTIKTDAALHYRLTDKVQLAYTYRFALIDNVYQRSNRFRLADYRLQQHGLTLTGGATQVRAFLTNENTGHSYNLRSAAENLDRVTKTDDQWFGAYASAFTQASAGGAAIAAAHQQARQQADAGRLQPGTAAFDQALDRLSGINNWDAGAALRVRAQLAGADAQLNLTQARPNGFLARWRLDALVGADYRTYLIRPDGNYFINPKPGQDGQTLTYGKTGGFAQLGRAVWRDRLRLTATVRVDKNDYFGARANPRLTAVYAPAPALNLRVAYQSGYRFPSIFEGFSNVNSGGVKRIGGLRVMSDGVFENSYLRASIDAFQAAVTRDFNTNGLTKAAAIEKNKGLLRRNDYTYLRPEFVRSWEAGYRGALLGGRLVVDVAGYF
ncbi:MAG: TonB-dependent receptor, partial [Hymenobacteraceae bacterium]|nr:TonB-dependent receptor [Hymenobacteraceae bacterium]